MGITVGVLALNKKAKSRAFLNLASEMAKIGYPLHIFGDDVIFGKDITEWPVFPALICFASDGFPLAKAQSYIELRKPFLINDPEVEADLGVRWKVYQRLKAAGVPCPEYLLPNSPNDVIVHKDGIVIDGKNLNRPFVEKPVNANNHDVWIYFDDPERSVRKLFRKTDSHASDIVTNGTLYFLCLLYCSMLVDCLLLR
jgi:inositol-hexakisphosphate/diphosphoinositol-pentakisphosphate 1-kinase